MRVTVRTPSPRIARDLLAPFEFTRIVAAAALGEFGNPIGGLDCDVILYDARTDAARAGIEAAKLRGDCRAPLLIAGAVERASGPDLPSAFDLAIPVDGPAQGSVRLLEEGLRHAIGVQELIAREASLADFLPKPKVNLVPVAAPLRALYCGKPHAAFLDLEQALHASGLMLEACLSISAAFDRLHEHAIDALIINLEGAEDAGLALCGALRRNAVLQGLPAAALTDAPAIKASAFAKGALEAGQASEIALRGVAWLAYFAQARRDQRDTQRRLEQAQSQIDQFDAFPAHFDRVVRGHVGADRPICLAALKLEKRKGAPLAESAWRKQRGEALDMARRLVRTTDCAAMHDASTIMWMLPCTPLQEAERLAIRALGVLEHTGFAGAGGSILITKSVCELAAGESSQGLLQRTLQNLG